MYTLVQVAIAFGVTREQLGAQGWAQLSGALRDVMLRQPSTYKAAVQLMMHFEVRVEEWWLVWAAAMWQH